MEIEAKRLDSEVELDSQQSPAYSNAVVVNAEQGSDLDRLNNLATVNSFIRNEHFVPTNSSGASMPPPGDHHEGDAYVVSHTPMASEFKIVNDDSNVWHSMTIPEVLQRLGTSRNGLPQKEAARRLHVHGPNKMTEAKKVSFWRKLWNQLNSVVVFILFIAMIASAALKEWVEVGLIIMVVALNTVIGLIQEGKAEAAAEAIKNMLTSNAMVVRAGQRIAVDAQSLVPGDVVFVQSGDRIPADVRLFEISSMQAFEAMLTGESLPVSKNVEVVAPNAALGDRKCMAYSATSIVKGQGLGVVVATGDHAEIGKINQLLSQVEQVKSNLLIQIDVIGRWLGVVVFIIGLAAFVLALTLRGESIGHAFTMSVTIAVAIIPEGLPTIVTITLAIAVSKMAARNAIVRQLACVETLGSVTVICSDKTGTLTKNEMTATAICTAEGIYEVTGSGYDPSLGTVKFPSNEVKALLQQSLMAGVLCNDSNLINQDLMWVPVGDPTEVALLTLAEKSSISIQKTRETVTRVSAIPFESEHKFMATFHKMTQQFDYVEQKDADGQLIMFVKGAPDKLIAACRRQMIKDSVKETVPIDSEFWLQKAAELSAKGLRVLALCSAVVSEKDIEPFGTSVPPSFVTEQAPFLTMNMLVAIIDPPRDECIDAIKVAHKAGIIVKMITGDHAQTAVAIGRMLGIVDDDHNMVITGPELDKMTDEQLSQVILKCNVYARSSPENKIRIVKALQAKKQISSMTGDGVNDAPALRAADIGVAMGITGTDVSKEASKIVLADDNFATILAAVEVGRQVWDNLRKILLFNQPVNFSQGLVVLFSIILNLPEPLSTIQVLYVNMITSITMGLMLAAEPSEAGIMNLPPRRVGKQLIGKKFVWRSIIVSLILVSMVLSAYDYAIILGYSPALARGVAFNTLVFCEMAYALNCRFVKRSSCHPRVFFGNNWCYVSIAVAGILQMFITYTPFVNTTIFSLDPLTGPAWGIVAVCTGITFVAIEIEKLLVDPIMIPIVRPLFHWIGRVVPRAFRLEQQNS
jgi:magnesium-transporting ATPase (P-type)